MCSSDLAIGERPLITVERARAIGMPKDADRYDRQVVASAVRAEEKRQAERQLAEIAQQQSSSLMSNPSAGTGQGEFRAYRIRLSEETKDAALRTQQRKAVAYLDGQPDRAPQTAVLEARSGASRLTVDWARFRVVLLSPDPKSLTEWRTNRPGFVPLPAAAEIDPLDPVIYRGGITKDRRVILGHECVRYQIVVEPAGRDGGALITTSIWTTRDLDVNLAPFYQLKFATGAIGNLLRETEGLPLLIETSDGVKMEAVRITPQPRDATVFRPVEPGLAK